MYRTAVTFAILIIAFLLLFRLSTYTLMSGSLRTEFILAGVAVFFFFIGVFVNRRSMGSREPVKNVINHQKINELGLSQREYEVLKEIANGLSNKQIAEKLFVSESTIKTHVSNLLIKMDAQRRTQAVQIARESGLL